MLDRLTLLHAQVREVHRELDERFTEWLRTSASSSLPREGRAVALYLHAATVEDLVVQSLLREVYPLFATTWQGIGPARYSTVDPEPIRNYAHDVFAATDAYLDELTPITVGRSVDLARLDLGAPTVAWIVSKFVVLELSQINGELIHVLRRRGAGK